MQAYNAAFDAGNVDGMGDLLTDDFKMVMHSTGKVTNKVEWKKQWGGFIGRNHDHVGVHARRAAACTCVLILMACSPLAHIALRSTH